MSIDSLELELEGQFDRDIGCSEVQVAASVDSLNQDLDQQFDKEFRSGCDSLQHHLPIRVLKRSRDVISAAKKSLAQTETTPRDYKGFVRFLAGCPVPTAERIGVQKTEFLGSGCTMTVFKGVWKASGKSQVIALNLELALGISSQEEFTADHRLKMASVVLEIRMMSHELLRNHPNIVRLLGITWHEEGSSESGQHTITPALILELAACIDGKPLTLEKYILANPDHLNLDTKTRLLAEIASGLAALHALGVVHGDVKPDNILLFGTSSRYTAKISDFGFCLAGDEDLEATKGGTPYWNAPECLPEASAEIFSFRHNNTRDFFSYGLVIWFVLFEEFPFQGDLKTFNKLKLQPTLKQRIDEMFHTRYRICPFGPKTLSTNAPFDHCRQEQYDRPSNRWVPCFENKQHLLRFMMQWVLVYSPRLRKNSFLFYERIFHDKSCLQEAQRTFETPGAWDAEWDEFGQPANRLRMLAQEFLDDRKGLYAIDVEELRHWGKADWGKLRVFENQSAKNRVEKLQGKSIPWELQKEIFQQSFNLIQKGNISLEHMRIIAESYMTGFGVHEDKQQALYWYRRAAEAGDPEASEIFIRNTSPASAIAQLGRNLYCQFLTEVLLAPFNEGGEGGKDIPRPARIDNLDRLRKIMSGNPDLTQTPLERAFQVNFQQRQTAQVGYLETDSGRLKSWDLAVLAIKEDDQEILTQALHENPDLIQGRSDNGENLAHIAVRYRSAGLLRMLVQDFNLDPAQLNIDGLTPLSLAVKFGATSCVRVLTFADRKAGVWPDKAAFDNASEGSGDLTRVLYEKFVDKQQDPAGFHVWSVRSLASSVINNNWGVLCTLLDIGIDPNATDLSSSTSASSSLRAPMIAAAIYNPLMLAILLAFGASPNLRVSFPEAKTALHFACGKYQDVADSLSGTEYTDLENFKDWTYSRTKVLEEDLPTMQKLSIWVLLQYGAELEARDYNGNTPLMLAFSDCPDLVAFKMLLEHHPPANINAANFSGKTLLHEAAREGNLAGLELFLRYGAHPEQRNCIRETALAIATKAGHLEICNCLLHSGASISARDLNGQNCLLLAVQGSHMEIINLFEVAALEQSKNELDRLILNEDCRGWNAIRTCIVRSATDDAFLGLFERWLNTVEDLFLDAQDPFGFTLLHTALHGNPACIELLLKQGASTDIKDSILGWTPLHHAMNEFISEDTWNLLLSYNADIFYPDDLMAWTPLMVLEKSAGRQDIDEGADFETLESERLARTRSKVRDRITAFYLQEAAGRLVRPLKVADLDALIDINRALYFPDQLDLDAALRATPERRLKKCFYINGEGVCMRVENVDPSRNDAFRI